MTTASNYPSGLDAFFTLIDGVHPIAADDFNILMQAIEGVQTATGSGPQAGGTGDYGPKGGAASVSERISNLMSADGDGITDFVFLTGTMPAYIFSEVTTGGARISFGKPMSGLDYIVLFGSAIAGEDADGTQSQNALGAWVRGVTSTVDSVVITARLANGAAIRPDNDTLITWGLLVFGPKAYY